MHGNFFFVQYAHSFGKKALLNKNYKKKEEEKEFKKPEQ